MPQTCVSPACNSGYPTNKGEEVIHYHRFPRTEEKLDVE